VANFATGVPHFGAGQIICRGPGPNNFYPSPRRNWHGLFFRNHRRKKRRKKKKRVFRTTDVQFEAAQAKQRGGFFFEIRWAGPALSLGAGPQKPRGAFPPVTRCSRTIPSIGVEIPERPATGWRRKKLCVRIRNWPAFGVVRTDHHPCGWRFIPSARSTPRGPEVIVF